MPVLTKDKRLTIAKDPDIVWIRSQYQIVQSVTLFDIEHRYAPNDAVAEIGIMSGGHTIAQRVAQFNSGCVGTFNALSWEGSYPTDADSYIYALILGPDNHIYRLAATLWKIISSNDRTFRVDP